MKTRILFFIISILLSISCKSQEAQNLTIWYDKPAQNWMTEALPIGNGYMGVMIFGGTIKDQIQFTEESLWTGGPKSSSEYNYGNTTDSIIHLQEIQNLLKNGNYKQAEYLTQKHLTGKINYDHPNQYQGDFGAQQNMGEIFIELQNFASDSVSGYKRSLCLSEGKAFTEFSTGKIQHKRTFFGNYPDKIMVYHYTTNMPVNYLITVSSPHHIDSISFFENTLSYYGHLLDNQMEFVSSFKIESNGKIELKNDLLAINECSIFSIYHTTATSYKNIYPDYSGNNPTQICKQTISNIKNKTYSEITTTQSLDYKNIFDRVEIELGEGYDSLPTDERLKNYANGANDFGLEELYFQYGRYLMISASREKTLPMNLQGKWNNSTTPPWSCDYHFNINEQMLYWPAEITNMHECSNALINYVESLVVPGTVSAKTFFGTRGWIVNVMNNIFGFTAPGWSIEWGYFPAGAAWISRHLWEHFQYNNDTIFLKNKALPIMKEAAIFWIDYLSEDKNGNLVSCPSFSPEQGGISEGASMDHQIVYDLMNNCINAYHTLNYKDAFLDTLIDIRNRILKPEIGRWGQLKEWKEDIDDPENKHRHVSHLFALYPACTINPQETPELAEAAKKSLIARGDDGTGWSLAWKILFWAKLNDGYHAYSLLRKILRPVTDEGYNMINGGGTYQNLLCAHPPFQLDGNMGAITGIAEMLLDPTTEKPLPALPLNWKNGYIKGLKTKTGKTANIYWENGKLKNFEIK